MNGKIWKIPSMDFLTGGTPMTCRKAPYFFRATFRSPGSSPLVGDCHPTHLAVRHGAALVGSVVASVTRSNLMTIFHQFKVVHLCPTTEIFGGIQFHAFASFWDSEAYHREATMAISGCSTIPNHFSKTQELAVAEFLMHSRIEMWENYGKQWRS